MIKVGIIGRGYFGKKIHNTLKHKYDIRYFVGRNIIIEDSFDVDWVVIASSTESHYRLCKQFIENGVNVFVEKPMTLSYDESKELINLSKVFNVRIYIDDIFLYNPIISNIPLTLNDIQFNWNKYGSFNDTIFNALTYHDIYIAIYLGYDLSGEVVFNKNEVNKKEFTIGDVTFCYDRVNTNKRKTVKLGGFTYDFRTNLNLLDYMFNKVFSETIDFESNNNLTLKAQKVLDRLSHYKPKVAVIGAGIFGITAALKLDSTFDVDLFEKNTDILQNASSINQYRLHRGYHYPRSVDTAISAKRGTDTFLKEYDCEVDGNNQYYAIAARQSKVNTSKYESFMSSINLDFKKVDTDLINGESIESIYAVDETLFDPTKLYNICKGKLNNSNINIRLGSEFLDDMVPEYDYIINCTYANINSFSEKPQNYQFELCEKPVVKLPKKYKGIGIVVMDGPFMCIDPYSDTDYHVMGNVVHAIHSTNIGKYPHIPDEFKDLINNGIIKNPPITNIDKFKESVKEFLNDIDEIEHIGSMYTIRTVLSDRDYDDARPSMVRKETDSSYSIFSGKISTAVDSSNELYNYLMTS